VVLLGVEVDVVCCRVSFLCFFRVFKTFLVGLATGRAVVFYE